MKKKSMDWYKQQQRFSVRKYHFGAASVLLGTALVFGGAQASADEVTAPATPSTESLVQKRPQLVREHQLFLQPAKQRQLV